MADTLKFDLVSPERRLASGEATMVVAPGVEGDFGAMPGHSPFFATLRPGVVTAQMAGKEEKFVVFGGFAEIGPDRCSILVEDAVPAADAASAGIAERIVEAEKALAEADNDNTARRAQYLSDLRALQLVTA
ncbi:MAG: F0F1 ATP synthase subunit epsilon [Neomegalonema sp.]|nr:F0F1 ATP synthase subunit epsilon [Neomegalonema sp.]